MPFTPENSLLNTLYEFRKLNHEITYVDGNGVSHPVTITPTDPNNTLSTSDGVITGYYSGSFGDKLYFRNKDSSYGVANSFQEIDTEKLGGGVYLDDIDPTLSKTFTYTVTANGETKTYTVEVKHDFSNSKNDLRVFMGLPPDVWWVNDSENTIPHININDIEVNWGS